MYMYLNIYIKYIRVCTLTPALTHSTNSCTHSHTCLHEHIHKCLYVPKNTKTGLQSGAYLPKCDHVYRFEKTSRTTRSFSNAQIYTHARVCTRARTPHMHAHTHAHTHTHTQIHTHAHTHSLLLFLSLALSLSHTHSLCLYLSLSLSLSLSLTHTHTHTAYPLANWRGFTTFARRNKVCVLHELPQFYGT